MAVNESQPLYCGSGMDNFHTSYKNLHGYISLIVCILGTIANTLNIIVLSRREMRSPTNTILTGLAVADLIVMLEYIPYTIHDYILFERLPREQQLSYSWACFIKFHSIFAQVLHTISIWLTVTLAVWRYIAVGYPQKNRQWCGMRTTIITITSAYVVCVLVVSPSLYLVTSIAEFLDMLDANGKTVKSIALSQYIIDYDKGLNNNSASLDIAAAVTGSDNIGQTSWPNASNTTTEMLLSMANSSNTFTLTASTTASPTTTVAAVLRNSLQQSVVVRNVTVYRLYHSDLALRNITLRNATFLIYSVLIKLIPCIALTILSIRLIMALLEAKRRRKMLTSNAANGMKPMASGKVVEPTKPRKNSKTLEKEKQTDRTTRMLLAVLLLFLITEFPQGIMGLLNTILGNAFLMQCYLRLSDLMDILALINSSINFILYCSMSRQFRTTFTLLFRPKFLDKWLPVAQDDEVRGGTNNVRGSDGFAARNPARGGQGKNGVQHDVQKIRQPLSVDNMAYDKQRNRRTTGNVLVEDNEDAGICQLDCKFSNKMKKNSDFIDECQTQFKDNYSNDSNCSNATEKPLNTTTACIDILNDENRDKNRNIQWFRSSSLTALSPLFSCLLCNIKRRHSFKCEHQQQHQKIINPCVNTRHQDIVGNSGFVSTIVVIRQDSSLDHHVYAAHSCNENCLSAASVTAGLPLSSSATTAASSCLLL